MALTNTTRLISGTANVFGYNLTGFSTQYSFGSVTPSNIAGNNTIKELYFDGSTSIRLTVDGVHSQNALFHTMHLGSNELKASEANFSSNSTQTFWNWSGYTAELFEPYLELYVYFSDDGTLDFGNYGVDIYNSVGRPVLTVDSKVSFFKGYFSGVVPANTPYYAVTVPGLVATDRILNMQWSKTSWIVQGTGYVNFISTSNNSAIPNTYGFLVISNGE